jgi:hypothetical protein
VRAATSANLAACREPIVGEPHRRAASADFSPRRVGLNATIAAAAHARAAASRC